MMGVAKANHIRIHLSTRSSQALHPGLGPMQMTMYQEKPAALQLHYQFIRSGAKVAVPSQQLHRGLGVQLGQFSPIPQVIP